MHARQRLHSGRRIIGTLNKRSKFKSDALAINWTKNPVNREILFDMGQNPVQLIEVVVVDHQLPFAFGGVLNFYCSAQGIGQFFLKLADVSGG